MRIEELIIDGFKRWVEGEESGRKGSGLVVNRCHPARQKKGKDGAH